MTSARPASPQHVDGQLRRHLRRAGLLRKNEPTCWRVAWSTLSGRGMQATRDVGRDELVYADAAVVQGPRCHAKHLPMCVNCGKGGCALFSCDRGCGLPVCSDTCQEDPAHADRECAYLRRLEPDCGARWSLELLQAVVPIRALSLPADTRDMILRCFESHRGAAWTAREVDVLKANVKQPLDPEDERFMRSLCGSMDTNSFETMVVHGGESTSLRALFPLGALTNHQCVPNTRHLVDPDGRLLVYAARPIAEGEELTMSYADLLWDTAMRRPFLLATKHFDCRCPRCSDPTESSSLLGALFCAHDQCPGRLLPDKPTHFTSPWTCTDCGLVVKSKQIHAIRAGIAAVIEEVIYKSPRLMLKFITRRLSLLVPQTNYFMTAMMFRIVSLFGRADNLSWSELTDAELEVKLQFCEKLINCFDKLDCGNCTKKGLILYELYCTNDEISKRIGKSKNVDTFHRDIKKAGDRLTDPVLAEAMNILKNDVAAPADYCRLYLERSSVTASK